MNQRRPRAPRAARRLALTTAFADPAPRHATRCRALSSAARLGWVAIVALCIERGLHEGVQPSWAVDPDHIQPHPNDRTAPHRREHDGGEPTREHQQAEWRIRAGDQQEDHRMVEPSHPAEWAPVTAATRNYGTAAAPRHDRQGCGQLASRLGAAGTGLLVLGGVLYSAVYALRRPNPVPACSAITRCSTRS